MSNVREGRSNRGLFGELCLVERGDASSKLFLPSLRFNWRVSLSSQEGCLLSSKGDAFVLDLEVPLGVEPLGVLLGNNVKGEGPRGEAPRLNARTTKGEAAIGRGVEDLGDERSDNSMRKPGRLRFMIMDAAFSSGRAMKGDEWL